MQNLVAPQDYYSFHSRLTAIRKIKNWRNTVELRQLLRCFLFLLSPVVTFDPKLRCPDRVTRVSGDASDVFRPTIGISFVRSFRGSVYTGRMPAQPPVRVMKKEPDVYEVEVAAARPTLHCVTAGAGDVECLAGGKANAERLIEESFRFLLERESNTSILRSFRITDISRYFPEYEREIRRRLAG